MVLIVRDPRVPHSRHVHQLVQAIDVVPTILELAGLPVPPSVQGRSLGPLLRTGNDPSREAIAVSRCGGTSAIRVPHWTLITSDGTPTELYRVASDPKEQHNLIAQWPDVAERLARRLDEQVGGNPAWPTVDPERWMQEHGYW
jgi:arylsulfatase A-like enzyme